ncbi:hypothetical protein DFJ74DRAFT_727824 [Hyaloraphidium curvatum]|nr:hypothetical protein DFJ74DRAFT_727824 [Hyaloraphidium curvatum]
MRFAIAALALLAAAGPAAAAPAFKPAPHQLGHALNAAARPAGLPAPPTELSSTGLVASACDGAPSPSCPAGQLVQVQAAFFGRDADPATCSAPPNATCALGLRDSAALTAWVAGLCDGRQSCSVPSTAAIVSAFGEPCSRASKITRVTFACRNAANDAPASPAPVPAGDLLRIRRPATLAQPKCPNFANAWADAANAGVRWNLQAQSNPTFARLSLSFVDIASSDLDAAVRKATNGAYSLATVSELNVTAFNFVMDNSTIVVAASNTGFTKLRISAVNIVSSGGGAIDVRSQGPDASGRFGPDVVVRARNVFGQVRIMQNGLTAGHPLVSTKTRQGYYSLVSTAGAGPEENGWWRLSFTSCAMGVDINAKVQEAFNCAGSNRFQPLCATSTTCTSGNNDGGITRCDRTSINWNLQNYYGSALWTKPQTDGLSFSTFQTDRFVIPPYTTRAGGKTAAYGTSAAQVAAFFSRDGTAAPAQSSFDSDVSGILSTADFTISMDRHPAAAVWSQHDRYNWDWPLPQPYPAPYLGLMQFMDGNFTYTQGTFDQMVMWASCPSYKDSYIPDAYLAWGGAGNITYTPATASADSYGQPEDDFARIVAGCADEMVSAGRFSDAQAFLADAAPSLAGSQSAAVARAFTVISDLRTARSSPAVHAVPFLSAATIEQGVQRELQAMVNLEANLTALASQGTTGAAALAMLQAANATMQATVDSALIELQGDLSHVQMLQSAFDTINSTYQDRLADLDGKREEFAAGVKKSEAAAIAELVIQFLFDIGSAIATDGAGAGGLEELVTSSGGVSALVKVVDQLDKLVPLLENLGKIFDGTGKLAGTIMSIVAKIEDMPTAPVIDVDFASAFGDNSTLASLSMALLNFQDLKDKATIYLNPAISSGIDGSSDYALALQMVANAGIDLVGLQTQLLSAQIKAVQSAAKLQSAQAAQQRIGALIASAQGSEAAVGAATSELALNLLERKMRALDLVYQTGIAFGYAQTATFAMPNGLPDPSTSAADFASAINDALAGLDNQKTFSQCVCNSSWIEMDPVFIGNLSSTGVGYLDLRDPSKPALRNYFGALDNVHMLQINVKPYGIRFNGTAIPGVTPTLALDITPTGDFSNTFTDRSGNRFVERFLAVPFGFSMVVEPTNNWKVDVPGSLTDDAAAKFYVPGAYGNFRISGDPNMVASWDWSAVWGVQVEIWGYAEKAQAQAAQATGLGTCASQCSSFSKQALAIIS